MKQWFTFFSALLIATLFFSCSKSGLDVPKIYFNTASTYEVTGGQYKPGTKCSIAVWCIQSENEKVKNRDFKVIKRVNDTTESVIFTKTFDGAEKEEYQYLMQHVCGKVGEFITYTFVVSSDKGVENHISQTFSVAN